LSSSLEHEIARFREVAATQLPDSVVGVLLYGSVAKGCEGDRSDVDLLVITEGDPTPAAREEVYAVCSRFFGERKKSISTESLERLEAFLSVGDPFVWNVLVNGLRIVIRPPLDPVFRRVATAEFDASTVVAFLQTKVTFSAQLLQAAAEAASVHLHMAVLSEVQAELLKDHSPVSVTDVVAVADYQYLLQNCPPGHLRELLLAALAAHSDIASANSPLRAITAFADSLVSRAASRSR
jgi:predicted nucleotidyltransferase